MKLHQMHPHRMTRDIVKKSLKSILALAIVCFTLSSFAQTGTYSILSEGNAADISAYKNALNAANFDSYRFVSKRRKITFLSGVEVELASATELEEQAIPVDISKALSDETKIVDEGIWKLTESGHIIRTQSSQFPKREEKR